MTLQDRARAEAKRRTTASPGTRTEDAEYVAGFINGAAWAIPNRDDLIDAITDAIAWTGLTLGDDQPAADAADAVLTLFHEGLG